MSTRIIDGHLDLAWNALAYDRDQTCSVAVLREREAAMTDPDRGRATVSLPEMRRTPVAVCLASLLARVRPGAIQNTCPKRTDIDHPTQEVAHAVVAGQLAYYKLLEKQGHLRLIHSRRDLDEVWSSWGDVSNTTAPAIGVVLTMEGADPVLDAEDLSYWWGQGLRALSLAHYGPGIYGHGTPRSDTENLGITLRGRELLVEMARRGIALDLTHSSDASFAEAIDVYDGPVYSSHSNCRAITPGVRQLTDAQLRLLIERDGVVGCVVENSMLHPDWRTGQITRDDVRLEHLAHHIDHVCQLAGSARHAAIGSDLDGGFGYDRCPRDLDTIADLAKLQPLLRSRGYSDDDIAAVFHGNWLRFLRRVLPGE